MKKIFITIGTIILSLVLTFLIAETFSIYHFGSVPTKLTVIYLISLFSILGYVNLLIVYIVDKKNKKENIGIKEMISMLLFFVSLILILGYLIILDIDWLNYYSSGDLSPFYINVLFRSLEFLLPSILLVIIGIFFLKKRNN